MDIEGLSEQLRKGEDESGDEDFHALHHLINGAGLADDQDVKKLRQIIGDERRKRLHAALDRMIDAVYQRRCAGDRAFLRRAGIRHGE